ncbi:hypothetical protein ABIA00_008207 [Bradyrhizobium ottawaense]
MRARTCSGEGFDDVGRGRSTGASTVTGGRFDCCACAPLDTDATAIKLATAETFLPETPANFSSTRPNAATERNDFGATTCPITKRPIFLFAHSLRRTMSVGIDHKIAGQCERLARTLESIQIKTILN